MVELGVFLPIGNNGWIMSDTAPQYMPTWELNRDVTLLAEEFGLDYVFSMAKWRGVGGTTRFWDFTLESLSLMSALAPLTHRIRLIGSVSPTLVHPAVFCKVAVTLDHVSGGRFILNIVSAGNVAEYAQMGLYPNDFESFRYEFTEEWVRVAKALWTEPSVTFKGRYFTLDDCHSDPKPIQQPHPPIVCATGSDRGMRFVVDHCDAIFLGGGREQLHRTTAKLHELAASRPVRPTSHALIMLVQADTDEEAVALEEGYRRGADWDAMARVYTWRSRHDEDRNVVDVRERLKDPKHVYYYTPTYIGGPQTIANAIEDLAVNGGVDGLVLTFPDYVDGLTRLHRDVMPILKTRGLLTKSAMAATADLV